MRQIISSVSSDYERITRDDVTGRYYVFREAYECETFAFVLEAYKSVVTG